MNGGSQKKIRTSLVLTMTLLVAVPVIALTVISLINTLNQGSSSANEVNSAQAALVSESLETIYMENIEALQALAASPATITYIENANAGAGDPDSLGGKILHQMEAIDASMADGNSTAISGTDGMQLQRTVGKPVNVAEREYFIEPMKGAPYYISDMIVSKSTGTAITTISVPIIGSDGSTAIGIVQRNYDLSVLHDMLASYVT